MKENIGYKTIIHGCGTHGSNASSDDEIILTGINTKNKYVFCKPKIPLEVRTKPWTGLSVQIQVSSRCVDDPNGDLYVNCVGLTLGVLQ
jgi:hypothetical protein